MGSTGWVISPFWECPFQKQGGILAELCIARRYWCVCSVSRHSSYSYTLNYHKYTQGKSNKTTLFLYNFSKLFVASRLATVLYHWEWVCWTFSCFYGVLLCTKSSLTNDIGTIFQLRLLWISLFLIREQTKMKIFAATVSNSSSMEMNDDDRCIQCVMVLWCVLVYHKQYLRMSVLNIQLLFGVLLLEVLGPC